MSDGRQASILIVDDNSLNRKKLKLAVKTLGYSAELAENGAQALDMLKGGQYDAMLLDLLMPEMDGFEVLITVDADDVLRDIPVIVISDLEGDTESVSRALSAGAEDFLPKGFDPVILNARLTACLRKKHFRDQELAYFKRVNALTDAAAQIEAGRFDETSLAGLEQESQRKDPIGNLASVFKGMAKEIHAREVRLLERIRLLQGSVLLVVVAAFSGLTPSLSRMASGYGSTPFGLAVWVDVCAALLALGFVIVRGKFPRLQMSDLTFFASWAFLVGILQHVTVFYFAEQVEATYLTMVLALESMLVFCYAALCRIEKASLKRIFGLIVGFGGIGVGLLSRLNDSGGEANLWLIGALILPAIFALESIALSVKRPKNVDPVAAVGMMFAFSVAFAVPLALLSEQWIPVNQLYSALGIVVLALAVVSIVSNAVYILLLEVAGVVFASQVSYGAAIAGILWGMLLLQERLTVWAWLAIGLVLLGMYLVETKSSDKPVRIQRNYRD